MIHREARFFATPDGGFVVEGADGAHDVGIREGRRWRVAHKGLSGQAGWSLATSDGGFVLHDADRDAELGRTAGLLGAEDAIGPRFVLLDDGRMFRLTLRGPRGEGFELTSWETPGAYLSALPQPGESGVWRLVPSAASVGLPDIEVLSTLIAAEVLRSEGRMRQQS